MTDRPEAARKHLETILGRILRGPDAAKDRAIVLGAADEYGACLIETHARPDDRWVPVRAEDGSEEKGGAA